MDDGGSLEQPDGTDSKRRARAGMLRRVLTAGTCCVGGALVVADYEKILTDIGYEDVTLSFQDASCGEACSAGGAEARSVAVTARKPGSAEQTQTLRPAIPADRSAIESLLSEASLAIDGLRTEDAVVAIVDGSVVGAVALERFEGASLLRSLVVAPAHRNQGAGRRLVITALEVARWAGADEIYLQTENAQRLFSQFGFEPVSEELVRDACAESALVSGQCCTTATAMRLSFEEADLPLMSKPSIKPLPTFQDGACC